MGKPEFVIIREFIRDNVADTEYRDFADFVKDEFGYDLDHESPWGLWPKEELESWLEAWYR